LRNFDALQHEFSTNTLSQVCWSDKFDAVHVSGMMTGILKTTIATPTTASTQAHADAAISRTTATFCLILSMSLVGSYVALSKPLTLVLPVFLLSWLRFGIGGLAMLHWLQKPINEPAMSPQTKRLVFVESFLGNFLFSICMLYGVSMTSAVTAGVIMAMIPAVVALMSWAFLRERISLRIWAAIACGVLGIALYTLSNSELLRQYIRRLELYLPIIFASIELNSNSEPHITPSASLIASSSAWLGNLLLFGAVLCESAYVVIGKKLTTTLSPKRISALINAWGFALITPFGIYFALHFDFHSVPMSSWFLLIFYALAASVWSVWLWMTGLKVIPASAAGVYTVFLPLAAALIGVFVLGENLNFLQMIGFALALLGVILATLPSRKTTSITSE
jgi:drug/metabolite transporter (DMT)-like permease